MTAPGPSASHPAPSRTPTGNWYFVLTIVTAGLFAWVPFLHAGHRLGRPQLRQRSAAYGGAAVVMGLIAELTPTNANGDPAGALGGVLGVLTALVSVAIVVGASVQLTPLRREVYGAVAPTPQSVAAHDPAVAAVLAARARRAEARDIVAKDPLMARDLQIGRPGPQRAYDDGGLVDLNTAPAATIAAACGVPVPTAELLVQAREARSGTFSDVNEALILAEIPVQLWDRIRDRAVLVP